MSTENRGTEDLLGQFKELGQQLERSIRKAWESNEGQEARDQIGKGLKELETQLGKVVEDVRKNQTVQDIEKQAKSTIESAGSEETTAKIRQEIGDALKSLNEQLNKLIKAVPGPKGN
jgi:ElaB/YqjD/DUF883 family membrane-anchored ribosome-binding protein